MLRFSNFLKRFRKKNTEESMTVKLIPEVQVKQAVSEISAFLKIAGLELPKKFLRYVPPVPLIQEVHKHLVPSELPEVREWCWDVEEIIQRITGLIPETILGAGYELKGPNPLRSELEDVFEEDFPLDEYVEYSVCNLVVHGNQLFVPVFEGDRFLRLGHVDWKTITHIRDPVGGHEIFIQKTQLPREFVKEKDGVFYPISYDEWKQFDPEMLETKLATTVPVTLRRFPEEVIYLKRGSRGYPDGKAMISPVVTEITYKKYLEFIMLRGAELWGLPILVGSLLLGLPPERIAAMMSRPEAWSQIQTQIDQFADLLKKYRPFGVYALGPHQKLDVKFPGRGMIPWDNIFTYLNNEIVGAVGGSLALFIARGTELATSRTIKSVWDHLVDGWRHRLEMGLNKQFIRMYKRVTRTVGKVKFKFRRLEVPEEIITQLLLVPREERRRIERLARVGE